MNEANGQHAVLLNLAKELGQRLKAKKKVCVTAESCTGGGIATLITAIPGSSLWFDRGFVTYSNEAKKEMLGVSDETLTSQGAVSEETVCMMAEGAIKHSNASISVAVSGVAGPDGGTQTKPVGTVWIAWGGAFESTISRCFHFKGNREAVRQKTVEEALKGLIQRLDAQQISNNQARYFFALWPDATMAEALFDRGKTVLGKNEGLPTPKQNLHLTLVYLGRVPPDFLNRAKALAKNIRVTSFEFSVTQANVFPTGNVHFLGLDEVPECLNALVKELNDSLLIQGFKPERRDFFPHITVARKIKKKQPKCEIAPLLWRANNFCLVKADDETTGSKYEIIDVFPLMVVKKAKTT